MATRFHLSMLMTASLWVAGIVQAVAPQPEEFRLRDEWLDRRI